jgi:hypothetical protein
LRYYFAHLLALTGLVEVCGLVTELFVEDG